MKPNLSNFNLNTISYDSGGRFLILPHLNGTNFIIKIAIELRKLVNCGYSIKSMASTALT